MSSELKVNSIRDTSNNEAITISSGNVSITNTLSAGTIGTGVTINAGTNVSGINQLVGISWNQNSTTGETTITVENNKSYVGVFFSWNNSSNYTSSPELDRFTVDGSGNVTQTSIRNWSSGMTITLGTNTITPNVDSVYQYATLLLFEEGQTIDTA